MATSGFVVNTSQKVANWRRHRCRAMRAKHAYVEEPDPEIENRPQAREKTQNAYRNHHTSTQKYVCIDRIWCDSLGALTLKSSI